jgi:hypothetical protein
MSTLSYLDEEVLIMDLFILFEVVHTIFDLLNHPDNLNAFK